MKNISVLDTSLTALNLANQIIMDGVNSKLEELFKDSFIIKLQCMDKIRPLSVKYIHNSNFSFIGGSNLLTSEINKYKQIGFNLTSLIHVKQSHLT
jgi:hypothetical protein